MSVPVTAILEITNQLMQTTILISMPNFNIDYKSTIGML